MRADTEADLRYKAWLRSRIAQRAAKRRAEAALRGNPAAAQAVRDAWLPYIKAREQRRAER